MCVRLLSHWINRFLSPDSDPANKTLITSPYSAPYVVHPEEPSRPQTSHRKFRSGISEHGPEADPAQSKTSHTMYELFIIITK